MSLRLPFAKLTAALVLVAAPAVGVATVVGVGACMHSDSRPASVSDGTAPSQTPSPSPSTDTTGWD
jgi:hypothetical protein